MNRRRTVIILTIALTLRIGLNPLAGEPVSLVDPAPQPSSPADVQHHLGGGDGANVSDQAQLRLQRYTEQNHLGSGFQWISASRVPLPELDDFADVGVAISDDGTEWAKFILLGSTGEPLSVVDLQRAENERIRARLGKLAPQLARELDVGAADSHRELRLALWTDPPPAPPKPVYFASSQDASAYRQRVRNERRQGMVEQRLAVVEVLSRLGARDIRVLDGPWIILATLAASRIDELTQEPAITAIDVATTEDRGAELYQTNFFYDADDDEVFETYSWVGEYGSGINVGVYELSGGCGLWYQNTTTPAGFSSWSGFTLMSGTADPHGCDQPGAQDGDICNQACNNGPGYCRDDQCMKEHVTMVASKLGCVRGGEARNASEMHLYYANSGSKEDRLNWLANNGVTIINDSEAGGNSPFVNWSIRNDFITVTRAAGNSQAQPVDCPDNTICTGSYSIASTANIDWWKSDPANLQQRYGLSGSTSFIDVTSRWDAEKPDVMGNGEATLISEMVTPRSVVWAPASGTSFAAPMIGGLVALLQAGFPTAQIWPELVRPMVMVSAISHNVTGLSISRNGGIDEKDGAGVPTASVLQSVVDDGTYRTLTLVPGLFDASNRYVPPGAQVTLAPSETARAVLGWMYCVENNMNFLSADFDLEFVEQSSGVLVDWSTSFTNSLEMVQFTNDSNTTKTYELRIVKAAQASCDGLEREYAGLAWTKVADDLGPSRAFAVSKTVDTNDFNCDADCSLREAIRAANAFPGRDRIDVPAGTYALQIAGTLENAALTGDLDIVDDLELYGAGPSATIVSGNLLDRVFHVLGESTVEISGLMMTFGSIGFEGGGLALSAGNVTLSSVSAFLNQGTRGGGIWNNGGTLTLQNSNVVANVASVDGGGIYTNGGEVNTFNTTIADNTAANGGGVYNANGGFVWLRTTTVTANEATGSKGGGIRNFGDLQLNDSTISGNSAVTEGGGVWTGSGHTAAFVYVTLKGNEAPSGDAIWSQSTQGFQGTLIDGGCSTPGATTAFATYSMESPGDSCGLVGGANSVMVPDLMLGELRANGGPTSTHVLLPRSPAIDPSLPAEPCPALDQRGVDRPQDADGDGVFRCDVGSVEVILVQLSFSSPSALSWTPIPGAMSYDVYRGDLLQLTDGNGDGVPDSGYGTCVTPLDPDPTDTLFVDGSVPIVGGGFFYLRNAVTSLGDTSLGVTSAGLERLPLVPCP